MVKVGGKVPKQGNFHWKLLQEHQSQRKNLIHFRKIMLGTIPQSHTQSPLAFWSAGNSGKSSGLLGDRYWVRDCGSHLYSVPRMSAVPFEPFQVTLHERQASKRMT